MLDLLFIFLVLMDYLFRLLFYFLFVFGNGRDFLCRLLFDLFLLFLGLRSGFRILLVFLNDCRRLRGNILL